MDALLQRLRDLGLGAYEAKLYLALVSRHPATGYELARASGVPSSKVYEVLARLQEKDIVFIADGGGRGRHYIPADPEEFVARYARRMTRALDGLKQDLADAGHDDPVDYIWNLRGRDALLERARDMLARAERTVLLSGWDAGAHPARRRHRGRAPPQGARRRDRLRHARSRSVRRLSAPHP